MFVPLAIQYMRLEASCFGAVHCLCICALQLCMHLCWGWGFLLLAGYQLLILS